MSKIEDKTVFSTCLIGDRAAAGDELAFFTVARGQHMPQVPRDARRCTECQQPEMRVLGDTDTNIIQAGQTGSALGDARFDRIRAVLKGGDPVSLDATVVLRIAGKKMLETTLEKLVAGWVQLEDEVPTRTRTGPGPAQKVPFVLVSRDDTVEARLTLNRETKIVGEPIAVRLEIAGKFITEDRDSALVELINA